MHRKKTVHTRKPPRVIRYASPDIACSIPRINAAVINQLGIIVKPACLGITFVHHKSSAIGIVGGTMIFKEDMLFGFTDYLNLAGGM